MSVQASPSRPATKSVGAAFVDLVLTLVILIVVLLAFLIAPLVALGLAYLAYAVLRPRANRTAAGPASPPSSPAQPGSGVRPAPGAFGFGAGTSQ